MRSPGSPFEILPHEKAPLFSERNVRHPEEFIAEIRAKLESGESSASEMFVELIREAGFVSLFFFLSKIASFSGPYEKLGEDLHLRMCNFRQSPASMQRGARAAMILPRGFYKTLCKGTKILTRSGLKNVEDVIPGDFVPSIDSQFNPMWTKVVATQPDRSECFRVRTISGKEVICADKHYFKTLLSWVSADSLKPGDRIGSLLWGVTPTPGTDSDYFIGLIYGDGGLTSGMLNLTSFDPEIIEFCCQFWPDHLYRERLGRISFHGGMKWWKEQELPVCKSICKTWPERFDGNAAFLRGLFDTDGSATKTAICFMSASKSLAEGVMRNLLYFGIHSSIVELKTGKAWMVSITGRSMMRKFLDKIGFRVARKIKDYSSDYDNDNYRTTVPQEWRSLLAFKGGEAIKKIGIRIDNQYATNKSKVLKALKYLKREDLNWVASENVSWEVIDSVERIPEDEVIHLEVEADSHAFAGADGLIHHNSTIGSHGADTWEALRNPNIRIRIISEIVERAHSFKNICKSTFDSNAFFAICYPEYVPGKSTPRWNETEFVLPNRTRNYTEPTISAGGATGASEGIHVDLLDIDDIEGLEDVDALHRSNASMQQKKKWFATNSISLLVDLDSRINLRGTFYGSDDVHAGIMNDAKLILGYKDPEFAISQNGTWAVYYRSWIEDGKEVFPEVMTQTRYDKLLVEDPWTAITQYGNKPNDPTVSEFYKMTPRRCRLLWDSRKSEWVIQKGGFDGSELSNWEEEDNPKILRLGGLAIGMFIDPAGTERGISAKSSRTAINVIVLDSLENAYLIWSRVGYYSTQKMFDLIFEGCQKFGGLIQVVGVESNAMQTILAPLLEKESRTRNYYINPQPIPAKGDKEARIRSTVGRFLSRGLIWLAEGEETAFEEERLVFPGNEFKRDCLDSVEKGLTYLSPPSSQEETELEDDYEDDLVLEPTRCRFTGM